MSTKKQITEQEGVYFITFTCYQWLALFDLTAGYDMVYKWFNFLKSKGHHIVGYVTMPNHVHALIAFTRSDTSINTQVGNGKRFIAYELVERLQENNELKTLSVLAEGVSKRELERGKLHEVFETSFDWKECRSQEFIIQKLDYMHSNPCKGVWTLAKTPSEYPHSSAKFYATGEQGIYPVTHCGVLEDMDLTKEAEIK